MKSTTLTCAILSAAALSATARAATFDVMTDDMTNAAPLVLEGDLTITGTGDRFVQTGAVSGTGDLHFNLPGKTAFLLAPNTSVGNLYVDLGRVTVTNASALGTGTVYVNEEATSGIKRLCFDDTDTDTDRTITLANDFVLGTENTASWSERLLLQNGSFTLSGALTVNNSKLCAANAQVTLTGTISGNKLVLAPNWNGLFRVERTPFALTESFWVGNGGNVHLAVAGATASAVYGFSSTTLTLDGEDFFPVGAKFASQNNASAHLTIDVAGHDQHLGSFTHEGAGTLDPPCTLRNGAVNTCPTITLAQAEDCASTNLHFSGAFNLVKTGTGLLTVGDAVNGDLTVSAGTYALGSAMPGGSFAQNVVVGSGGVLDLGGRTVRCRTLTVEGGSVVNGTISADRTVLKGAAHVSATVMGDLETEDGASVAMINAALGTETPAQLRYQLPAGTALYFPFDGSEVDALGEKSGHDAILTVTGGAPVWSAEGRLGGCLYFDGSTTLEAATFPSSVPVGGAPVSVASWIKIGESCSTRGGWLSYGAKETGRGSSIRLWNSYQGLWWYANDIDMGKMMETTLDDGQWHYVVMTFDGATWRIYCDGTEVVAQQMALNTGSSVFMLGKTMYDDSFTGWLDDVLIVNRALEAAEIQSLYTSGGVPRETVAAGRTLKVGAGTLTLAPNDCVMNYPFKSSETLFEDASGHGQTLILGGGTGATASADSPFATGAGSLALDGQTWLTTVQFPGLPTGNAPRSVACFLKPASTCAAEGAMLSWGSSSGKSGTYMNFALRSSGQAMGLFPWGAEDRVTFASADSVKGVWTSFVAVWDGTEVTYYTNGVRALGPRPYMTTAFTELATTAENFQIGVAFYKGSSYYTGNLAELAVWDRALTANEARDYALSGVVSTARLAADISLEVAAGATCRFQGGGTPLLAGLSGAGTVEGRVTLNDGATVTAQAGDPVTVTGTLTFAGSGTVVLPQLAEGVTAARYTLFSANAYVGEANLASWRCMNVPKNYRAEVRLRDGVVEAVVGPQGLTLFLR